MDNNELILDGHKLFWHTDRVNDYLQGKKVAPITIDCALTTHCNYNCTYCYAQLQRKNTGEHLPQKVVFDFLKDAADIGVKGISFVSDGESTCNPSFAEAIVYGKSLGLDMALGTNGFLLNEKNLEQILSALTYLRFNISAGEPKRYSEIHGVTEKAFETVCQNIRNAVRIKKENNLEVTIGLQMVLMPAFGDQIIPLARLGRDLGVDYLVLKHCSDDEKGSLGVQYDEYKKLQKVLEEAESFTTETYLVKAKWSKILSGGKRIYSRCYAPPLMLQISGSGIVAPCGAFFNDNGINYQIGNLRKTGLKDLWNSDKYWSIMNKLASNDFNAHTDCGTLCLQHKVNEYLWELKKNNVKELQPSASKPPQHINFI